LTKAKRHLNRIYTSGGTCHETEKKVSGTRLVPCSAGGDASIQRGAFFAAAPWRGVQATPSMFRVRCWVGSRLGDRYWPVILPGEPPPGTVSVTGGEDLQTCLGQPPSGRWDGKGSFFVQNGPCFRLPTRLPRETPPVQPRNKRSLKPPHCHSAMATGEARPRRRHILLEPPFLPLKPACPKKTRFSPAFFALPLDKFFRVR
jgi:hypothetical protein